MSDGGDQQPSDHQNTKPPCRHWRATEPFFDLKASHYVEISLTLALLAVGGCQAYIYWRQAGIMKAQTKILLGDQRAWIGPPTIQTKLVGTTVEFRYTFKNVGKTPTSGLHITGDFMPSATTANDWVNTVTAHCKKGKQVATEKSSDWKVWAIVPQSDFVLVTPPPFGRGEWADLMKKPVLVGCVTYGQSLSSEINTTGFFAEIRYGPTPSEKNLTVETVYAIAPN